MGPDIAPERQPPGASSLFFIAWIFVGSFIGVNLFVGVVVDNFNRIKAERDG